MKCSSCGFDDPIENKFCRKCGNPLPLVCIQCHASIPGNSMFCGACGAAVTPEAPDQETPSLKIERRQITVMFCDLVGSTALSQQLDPEELSEHVVKYREVCAEAIKPFDGYIARYMGDGLLIYFGYPTAHEDDARRAILAGLAIIRKVKELNLQGKSKLAKVIEVRIGIHTGLVIAGELGKELTLESHGIVGETPNLAARLQGLAEPNTVVISKQTLLLTQGYFEFKNLGDHQVKGISEPIRVFEVIKESVIQTRFAWSTARGLTPLVGRSDQLASLNNHWQRSCSGQGQIVLLGGEAGIGKSRLVHAFIQQLGGKVITLLETQCSPYHHNSGFYPWIGLLERIFELNRDLEMEEIRSQLHAAIKGYGLEPQSSMQVLTQYLSLPLPRSESHVEMDQLTAKKKFQEIVLTIVTQLSQESPTLLVVEDLHWADPSSLELLTLLIQQAQSMKLMALLTFRETEFRPPWPMRAHITAMILSHLNPEETKRLATHVVQRVQLPAELLSKIATLTDGVPLFIEELTQAILDTKLLELKDGQYQLAGSLFEMDLIPNSLQDALMARLDRLDNAKLVAQTAAALGREFSFELLSKVSKHPVAHLESDLEKLVETDLLYKRGVGQTATFQFKHALIQDAAYQSLPKQNRIPLHRSVVEIYTKHFPEDAEKHPELIASHATRGELYEQALGYWLKAADKSNNAAAYLEAQSHCNAGLQLLDKLPEGTERDRHELMLLRSFVPAEIALKGFGSEKLKTIYKRVRELCHITGEHRIIRDFLINEGNYAAAKADYFYEHNVGEELLEIAKESGDPYDYLVAYVTMGYAHHWFGHFVKAKELFQRGLSYYDPEIHNMKYTGDVQDIGVASLADEYLVTLPLGYPDQASHLLDQAQQLAVTRGHPFNFAQLLLNGACQAMEHESFESVLEKSSELLSLSEKYGYLQYSCIAKLLIGLSECKINGSQEGYKKVLEGYQQWQELVRIGTSMLSYFKALSEQALGMTEEGLMSIEFALKFVEETDERIYESQLLRLQGELLQTQGHTAQAEKLYRQSMEIAQKQEAKWFELKATLNLSKMLLGHGRKDEAREFLTPIYNWFTEGFDTKLLQDAKTLLNRLE